MANEPRPPQSFKYQTPGVERGKTIVWLSRTDILFADVQVLKDGGETNLHAGRACRDNGQRDQRGPRGTNRPASISAGKNYGGPFGELADRRGRAGGDERHSNDRYRD